MSLGRVFVAGHRGMVGSAIIRRLEQGGEAAEILTRRPRRAGPYQPADDLCLPASTGPTL